MDKLKRNPPILIGDLIRSTGIIGGGHVEEEKKGALMIVNEVSSNGTLSTRSLPGQPSVKCAWWYPIEWELVEKGPAHKYWNKGIDRELEKIEQGKREETIEWVVENWRTLTMNSRIVHTILKHMNAVPDTRNLAMKGEIGIIAMVEYENLQHLMNCILPFIEEGKIPPPLKIDDNVF